MALYPSVQTTMINRQLRPEYGGFVEFSFPPHRITVNMPDAAALIAEVRRRLSDGRGFALATINLDHLVKLAQSPEFRKVYAAQDLVCADGNPIVWLSKLARKPVTLVPGSDMVIPLAAQAARVGVAVALVGSTEDALAAAAGNLRESVPGLRIATCIAPPMGFDPTGEEAAEILHRIDASGARMVFIALGAPKQEAFAAYGRELVPDLGFASIGAGLDFLAGHQARAPRWVRAIAMEWAWRMLSNPRRLVRRYAECAMILPGHAVQALRQR
jgi:N-acetylglucosaminyldiphosphoundecaprenol N-acetyl-beta-D-mannosaminyltransferase